MSNPAQAQDFLTTINSTKPTALVAVREVQTKFIKNYNASHREKNGDLVWQRNVTHFQQAIQDSYLLQKCTTFSLYAVLMTAAANGYSLDPADNEVYILPYKGKAKLQRQAGAHIRRLKRTEQIDYCQQPKIVYDGDDWEIEDGRVIRHRELGKSDNMLFGYVKMILPSGNDLHFIYWKRDWKDWQKRSANPHTIMKRPDNGGPDYISESPWDNGILNGTQPEAGFIKTKIVKHAANEKCWGSGTVPAGLEQFDDVEVDADDFGDAAPKQPATPPLPAIPENNQPAAKEPAAAKTPEKGKNDPTDLNAAVRELAAAHANEKSQRVENLFTGGDDFNDGPPPSSINVEPMDDDSF